MAAAQAALGRDDLDSARQLLKAAQKHQESAHFFAAAAELAAARGNHRGAKERLKQALTAEPALVPHLLPGLIAAEQGLAAQERAGHRSKRDAGHDTGRDDDLEDAPAEPARRRTSPELPALPAASGAGGTDRGGNVATAGGASEGGAGAVLVPVFGGPAGGALAVATPGALVPPEPEAPRPVEGVPLVPSQLPAASIAERVIAVLAEIEAEAGPRLELALIRAQLVPPADTAAQVALAGELLARFPDALAARVAAARLAIARDDAGAIRGALDGLVSDQGALAWALRGRWQCAHCGNRPGPFSWRCAQCRRWNTLRMETGVEPPPVPPRERRAAPRAVRPDGLLGAPADQALPAATLDAGLSDAELASAGTRRSLLGRVGGWFSDIWRRDAS